MKSPEIFGGFIFYCYLCINKKEQHYENYQNNKRFKRTD